MVALCCIGFHSMAQDSSDLKWYNASIIHTDHSKISGYLYELRDDSILIIGEAAKQIKYLRLLMKNNLPTRAIPTDSISKISIRNKSAAPVVGGVAGLTLGLVAGAAIVGGVNGGLSGIAALGGGFTGLITGIITGILISHKWKKNFILKGSREKYKATKGKLQSYTLF